MSILVLGLGNMLMNDDALGVKIVQVLQSDYRFPPQVKVIDGGTLGLDLLPMLEGIDRLLIIDALEIGAHPGTILRVTGDEVPRVFASKLSIHQMGVQDLLTVAELQGYLPRELVVWGVQPGSIEMEMALTPEVSRALPQVIAAVIDELTRWGAPPELAA
ncbi:MAG: HyaD/HybD family hydrogenase maturation endopeptidase [Desulfuromonadaceae bacterium]|nr:HyaD/HybD family hydrogenase maturation endopeptidase [Desulfuromonadaceae bacterium]